MNQTNPVTDLARERSGQQTADTFTVDGVTLRFVNVPASVVQDAVARLKPPQVPTWYNPDKARDEDNPNDPGYLLALERYGEEKGRVANDALIMFGVEVVEGFPPEDDKWLKKIRRSATLGLYDLDWVDWDDETDLEYLFKKYRAMTVPRLVALSARLGLNREAIAQAVASFRGDEERSTDSGGQPPK